MRRIIQSTGVEVIHLGHDRSVEEVVNTAIQEDANAIAMTCKVVIMSILNTCMTYLEKGIKIFGGGRWCDLAFRNCRTTSLRNHAYLRPDMADLWDCKE
jgi:hypothetical protein